jgi:UPF0716 family protein affecting phage T7 exclusion
MNPLNIIEAISFTFKAIFVVALCYFINAWTSPGAWWAHWVLFGMGIALFVKWASALKTVLLYVVIGAIGLWLYKRYGANARERFYAWAQQSGASQATRDVIARISQRTAKVSV